MDISIKIDELKKSIQEAEKLVEKLVSSLKIQKLESENKDKKIFKLKEEVRTNIKKIDEIIKDYNANT